MKKILIIFIFLLIVLVACSKSQTACTEEAKLCPDGSYVGRIGPNCEFAECPKSKCDYTNESMKYVAKSIEECAMILIKCEPSYEFFSNECGCGCKLKSDSELKLEHHYCTGEKTDVCIEIYKPVCGWFDPAKIQCLTYPCAGTYPNSCYACKDDKVQYWTEDKCPNPT